MKTGIKKADMAHAIVWENYNDIPVYHEYRKQGFSEISSKIRTERYFVRNYTKEELKEMYDNL